MTHSKFDSTSNYVWLVIADRVICSAELATTSSQRRRGLLGRDSVEGALLISKCRWVHTLGMKFAIDVAFLDNAGRVVKTKTLKPNRISAPVPKASTVVESEAGSHQRWGLKVGDVIEVRRPSEVNN